MIDSPDMELSSAAMALMTMELMIRVGSIQTSGNQESILFCHGIVKKY